MSLPEQRRRGAAPRIAIIGSGFSGLCLGIQLSRAGFRDFAIYEKASGLGGTWRDNTYPGAACDLPSMAYCFSFEQKGDWSRKWSPQDEILDYMEH
ncbi:MAG: NAD(P)-binding protein, partial [Myxococcota bacterium]|nr:NAD(P)-binding protein [Myxococcota bacterium]